MKRILIISCIFLFCFGCRNSNEQNKIMINTPEKTVIAFLNWYKIHYDSIGKFVLVKNSDYEQPDSTKLYRVNFGETEKYLSALNSSGFISEKYLADQRKYFLSCDSNFKVNPEFDGPPDGFDYDLVMISQDYEDDLNHPELYKLYSSNIKPDSAELIYDTPDNARRKYSLKKENDSWKILSIENIPIMK
ncbi:MAG: hypothetical protein ACHQK8_02070 [Bacteroidia bacterium]